MLRILFTLMSVAMLAMSSSGHAATAAKQKLELRGGAKLYEYVLPNQLTLIVIEKPDAPLTSIYHWVKAGSLNETPGITGIAHLFEHMMFRPLAPGEPSFDDKVNKFGASINASTRFESTVYTTTAPTRHLAAVLQAEAARFKKLKVTDELLDVEREAVRSEYQTGLDTDPNADLGYQIYIKGFPGHPLGWQIVGQREDLDKIKAADCNAFFAKLYRPNNTGLIIGGPVSAPDVLRMVEASYADWEPGPKVATPASYTGRGAVMAEGKLVSPARSIMFGFRMPLYADLEPQALQLASWIVFQSSYNLARRRLSIDQTLATSVSDVGFDYLNGMLIGSGNVLANVPLTKLQEQVAQLGSDYMKLSDVEYNAYLEELFIRVQDTVLRNEGLVAFAAQSWGKYGGLQYMQNMLAGKSIPDLRGKAKAIVEQYIKADNLVLVHGKGDK